MRAPRTVLIGIAAAALLATGCEWNFQTLDGEGGPHGQITNYAGYYNSAIVYNGAPHVFSQDEDAQTLRHGYWNGQFWAFETLDGAGGPNGRVVGNVGWDTTAVLYNGRPHVFYPGIYGGSTALRHAYHNGSSWVFETLDGKGGPNGRVMNDVGNHVSVVLYNGRPHVFYYDSDDDTLRHGYWNGVAWTFETLDGNGGAGGRINAVVGEHTSVTLYNGRPHVFYHEGGGGGNLRHAYWSGVAWGFETLDGAGGANGRVVSALTGWYTTATLYNQRPHVFYHDQVDNSLRHGYWNGSFWAFETLDGNGGGNGRVIGDVGEHGNAIVYGARPRVFYSDRTQGDLRQAYWNGQTWAFETLDGHQDGPNGRVSADRVQYTAVVQVGFALDVYYFADLPTVEVLRHGRFS